MNLRERRQEERARKIARRIYAERQQGVPTHYPVLDTICAPPPEAYAVPATVIARPNPPPRR